MKLQVGRTKSIQPTINPVTKELEVMQDGKWVPAKNTIKTVSKQPSLRLGIFEPIEVPKDKLSELLLLLNSEKINYQYHIEKQGNSYFLI